MRMILYHSSTPRQRFHSFNHAHLVININVLLSNTYMKILII